MAPGPSLASSWTQFFPPKPTFTEKNVGDLKGKVYIVTGANTGLGKGLAQVLYTKNAKVYIAARSEEKARKAIADIEKAAAPNSSSGELVFLHLDLADLESVRHAARSFLAREQKLHVLFNNAGVMVSPAQPPPRTKQGYELSLGVNCVGTFLFTKLLTPALAATAPLEPADTVRIVWLSSFGLELYAEEGVGIATDDLDYRRPPVADHTTRYGLSKAGAWALGVEYAKRHRADGIVSVPINPGNLQTELARDQGWLLKLIAGLLVYPAVNGVCTQLFAAFSPEITTEAPDWSEKWIIPFGRVRSLRPDLPKATRLETDGGTGGTAKFWEWNEEQVKKYL